jgi:hypothetical protein
MSNLTIFKQGTIEVSGRREVSDLTKSLTSANTSRRIQTNTNGTFKRLVNGEQIGNAVRGEINVIVIAALQKVSRVFYAGNYDPNAKPALPDCWSNLGNAPESAASSKQASSCVVCPQNVQGSGQNGGKACRYQRRIAILLAGDSSGEVYQFNIPAKSLFGKGTGNVHPFESYVKYLSANGESVDGVITNISYDINADSMELLFTPLRNISDDEYATVRYAQSQPEAKQYTMLTVAQTDGTVSKPSKVEPTKADAKVIRSDEPEEEAEEVVPQPVKRASKKAEEAPKSKADLASVLNDWGDED